MHVRMKGNAVIRVDISTVQTAPTRGIVNFTTDSTMHIDPHQVQKNECARHYNLSRALWILLTTTTESVVFRFGDKVTILLRGDH
jgi:hypothetical protein